MAVESYSCSLVEFFVGRINLAKLSGPKKVKLALFFIRKYIPSLLELVSLSCDAHE
jgi:hypothetical protein